MSEIIDTVGAKSGIVGSDVYPVGHVVQTTVPNRGATYTTGTPGSWSASVVNGSITPIYDDSAIIIFAAWCGDVSSETTGDHGYGIKWVKTGTGVVNASGSPLIGPVIQDEGYSAFYRAQEGTASGAYLARLTNHYTHTAMDNDCETTNTITYTLNFTTYNIDGNLGIGGNNWDNHQWSVYFQEIKR